MPRVLILLLILSALLVLPLRAQEAADHTPSGSVVGAMLVYGEGEGKSARCFSRAFLDQVREDTHIDAHPELVDARADDEALFEHPFTVMSGEGKFTLSQAQRDNLRAYLKSGGFIIASAGCSSRAWNTSFEQEVARWFSSERGIELNQLNADHPIYHSVYDIRTSDYKRGDARLPELHGLEIDGRTVLVWSPDGLNDTAGVGGDCCCCGGNEVKAARELNVNILAYAMTH